MKWIFIVLALTTLLNSEKLNKNYLISTNLKRYTEKCNNNLEDIGDIMFRILFSINPDKKKKLYYQFFNLLPLVYVNCINSIPERIKDGFITIIKTLIEIIKNLFNGEFNMDEIKKLQYEFGIFKKIHEIKFN